MSKNIIFLTAVDIPSIRNKRKDYKPECFQYGIKSFQNWAKDKNVEVVILDELLYPHEDMKVNFQNIYLKVKLFHIITILMLGFKLLIENINLYLNN